MSSAETAKQRLRALSADDFDHNNPTAAGWEELVSVCDQIQAEGTVVECANDMFDLMERLDASDLGSPGALVHALESTRPAYEALLQESLRRKPSPLAVWMVKSHPQHSPT